MSKDRVRAVEATVTFSSVKEELWENSCPELHLPQEAACFLVEGHERGEMQHVRVVIA